MMEDYGRFYNEEHSSILHISGTQQFLPLGQFSKKVDFRIVIFNLIILEIQNIKGNTAKPLVN